MVVPGLGGRAWCLYGCVCTLMLSVGEECVKGSMGVAGVRARFRSHTFGCVSLSTEVLCSGLGKGKWVCRGVGVKMLCVCACA